MASENFPVEKSVTEWRALLSADQFRVLREHGTERAGTSPLNYEKRTGIYHCAGCAQPLFESSTKYESGSGWPSFFRPLPGQHQLLLGPPLERVGLFQRLDRPLQFNLLITDHFQQLVGPPVHIPGPFQGGIQGADRQPAYPHA